MKITCEHCGTIIDTDKDKKCPSCHAPYSDNKEYSKVKDFKNKNVDYDLREREADIRKKEISNDILEKQTQIVKKASIIPIVFFIIFIVIFIFIFKQVFSQIKDDEKNINLHNNIPDIVNGRNEEEEEKNIVVNFKENAVTKNYEMTCDDVREYKYDWYEKGDYRPKDIKYYAFHIIFKNKSKNSLFLHNNIKLTYTDNKGNENISAKSHSANTKESHDSLELYPKAESNYSGNIFFEIPNYVNDIKIVYDKVTIEIKDFRKK